MTVTAILAALGVAGPLIEKGAALIESMIAAGQATASAEQAAGLTAAVNAAKDARAAYEAGNV